MRSRVPGHGVRRYPRHTAATSLGWASDSERSEVTSGSFCGNAQHNVPLMLNGKEDAHGNEDEDVHEDER
jgi:hypothetical protein